MPPSWTRLWHTTTLAEELSLEDTDEDDLYEAMDWLLERQDRIPQAGGTWLKAIRYSMTSAAVTTKARPAP